jgi:hypothetical protein
LTFGERCDRTQIHTIRSVRRKLHSRYAPVLFASGFGLLALGWALAGVPAAARGGRLGDAALWVVCVALATALTWRGGRTGPGSTALAGLTVALTASAVELGARHGGDGLAIAAALAVAAGLLRAWADRPRPHAWTWVATAAAAVMLAIVARPSIALRFDGVGDAARGTWESLWDGFVTWIGREPSSPGGLPVLGVVVWTAALLALVLAADRLAGARARRLLWTAVVLAFAATAFLYAGETAADARGWFGFGAPPPTAASAPAAVLPLGLLALLAGDVVTRAGMALWPRLAAGCFGLLGAVQVLAFVSLRNAAGEGATPWIAIVVAGAVTLAAAGAAGATGTVPARPPARPAKR